MKLLREPLLHFLVIGALLFGVFSLTSADDEPAPDEIVVSAGQIASLEAIFSRTWQRPPTRGGAGRAGRRTTSATRCSIARPSPWASTATTPSSAAACGRRWSSSPT